MDLLSVYSTVSTARPTILNSLQIKADKVSAIKSFVILQVAVSKAIFGGCFGRGTHGPGCPSPARGERPTAS